MRELQLLVQMVDRTVEGLVAFQYKIGSLFILCLREDSAVKSSVYATRFPNQADTSLLKNQYFEFGPEVLFGIYIALWRVLFF